MTSSNWKHVLTALTLFVPLQAAWASLGDHEGSVEVDRMRMHARHTKAVQPGYSVHELVVSDGSRVRQYVSTRAEVFAVTWVAGYKPNLADLLGASYASYSQAVGKALNTGGLRRNFRHTQGDLEVQSSEHLQIFTGYAVRRSLVPPGFNLSQFGSE